MVAIRKMSGWKTLLTPTGIFNSALSREEIDIRGLLARYIQRRRSLERDVNQRAADRFILSQYRYLFQEDPPIGMSMAFVNYRIGSYLTALICEDEGRPIDYKTLNASWGESATNNDYREFDEDVKIFLQAEILRRSEMTIARKNDSALAEKTTATKKVATAKEKEPRDMNQVISERIQRDRVDPKRVSILTNNPSIYEDTLSRFRAGTGRQEAFEIAKNILKKKQKPMSLSDFAAAFNTGASEEIQKGGYFPFVVSMHTDVFLVQDGTIILNPNQPTPVPRYVEPTKEEKEAKREEAKIFRNARNEAKKKAAASDEPVTATPAKKAVLLRKPATTPTA